MKRFPESRMREIRTSGSMRGELAALTVSSALLLYRILCVQSFAVTAHLYAFAPMISSVIGLLAGLAKRLGDTRRTEELLQTLQPSGAAFVLA